MELSRNPLYRKPGWIAAHARLISLFPDARTSIGAPYQMDPDGIWEAATDAGWKIESEMIFNPWRVKPEGLGTKPFEDYEALELFDLVFQKSPPPDGRLWFIPDECFGECEPYEVAGRDLRVFVSECPCSLTHDVLFIWCERPRVTLIHHEGAFFHLTGPSEQ